MPFYVTLPHNTTYIYIISFFRTLSIISGVFCYGRENLGKIYQNSPKI